MSLRLLACTIVTFACTAWAFGTTDPCLGEAGREPVRVFIFAGQSNMVGSDSKVGDIERFPPFSGPSPGRLAGPLWGPSPGLGPLWGDDTIRCFN